MPDLRLTRADHVAVVEITRPPDNFFDKHLIRGLAEAFEAADADPDVRSILLCAAGRNFCAGANFADTKADVADNFRGEHLYQQAVRLFRCEKPVVAAVQGAAVGGGLGLALAADFRVGAATTRFAANFTRLGIHPGFGVSVTLPRVVGPQRATLLLLTGRRIGGEEAHAIGLLDHLAPPDQLRAAALALATEIAACAPLAITSTRATLRHGLADQVAKAVEHELAEQQRQFLSADFAEGVQAMSHRRPPRFAGR